jgi:hypothetical protein
MSCSAFSCPWDSGQVGVIWVTRETVLREYNCKYITKKIMDKVRDCLREEVKQYDQHLTGDVWGYEIECITEIDKYDEETLERYDYCLREAKIVIDHYIKNQLYTERVTTVEEGLVGYKFLSYKGRDVVFTIDPDAPSKGNTYVYHVCESAVDGIDFYTDWVTEQDVINHIKQRIDVQQVPTLA